MSYIFFYPARGLGGVQLLFLRLARLLSGLGCRVFYIDFVDGYVAKRISEDCLPITLISYKPGELVDAPVGAILIVPLSFIGVISEIFRIKEGVKVLFWCLHPLNVPVHQVAIKVKKALGRKAFSAFSMLSKSFYLKSKNSLQSASHAGGLYFMDSPNIDEVSQYFDLTVDKCFLPIFLDHGSEKSDTYSDSKGKIRGVAWIGRIDRDSKFFILKKIISDFLSLESEFPLYIVGDGAGRAMLEQCFPDCEKRVIFLGEVQNKKLDSVLSEVDIVFAMGTSCLEAAAREKVVVKVDVFYESVPENYTYTVFSEIEGYDLGRVISGDAKFSGREMANLFAYIDSVGVSRLGRDSYEKYVSEYSTKSFMRKFESAVRRSCLDIECTLDFKNWFDVVFYKARGIYKKDKRVI